MQFNRLNRRSLITLIGGSAVWPLAARAQQPGRIPKVGILAWGNQLNSPVIDSFRREMSNLGYAEGRGFTLEFRSAAGDPAAIASFASELVQMPVDVILSDGTPATLAAKQATTTIPIVTAVLGVEPVAAGLITSYARPDGNITGFTILAPELGPKRLTILQEAVPGLKRVGVVWNAANPLNTVSQVTPIVEAAAGLRIEIEPGPVQSPDELAAVFEKFKARQVSAVITVAEAMLFQERQRIIELAMAAQLPGMFPDRLFAAAGGLLFYGPDVLDLFKRAAGYVDRILKGAKVGDLPFEQPTRFELVINLKTAKALGIAMPPTLLALADEVIE
jgi:putative ABC transport system substrate-binding protein